MSRSSRSQAIVTASVLAVCLACARAEHGAHETAYPTWAVFPVIRASVPETLAGLFDSGSGDFKVSLRTVAIFETDTSPWEEIFLEDLPPPIDLAEGSYAIAAHRFCRTWGADPILVGANEWYLFREGRLAAYDSRTYRAGCGFVPAFEPARGGLIDTEAHIRRWIAERLPPANDPSLVHYARGIAYADAGRLDMAEQCLESGDSTAPTTANVEILASRLGRPVGSAPETLRQTIDEASARRILASEIERLRGRHGDP